MEAQRPACISIATSRVPVRSQTHTISTAPEEALPPYSDVPDVMRDIPQAARKNPHCAPIARVCGAHPAGASLAHLRT
jgi:hypothetical protein